jgi:hypothetical protein
MKYQDHYRYLNYIQVKEIEFKPTHCQQGTQIVQNSIDVDIGQSDGYYFQRIADKAQPHRVEAELKIIGVYE